MLTYSVYTTGLLIFPPNKLLYSNLSNRKNRGSHYNLSSKVRYPCTQAMCEENSYLLLVATWTRNYRYVYNLCMYLFSWMVSTRGNLWMVSFFWALVIFLQLRETSSQNTETSNGCLGYRGAKKKAGREGGREGGSEGGSEGGREEGGREEGCVEV